MEIKVGQLIKILKSVAFKQCLVFSNYHTRAQSVCSKIIRLGQKAAYIAGKQDMDKRLEAIEKLKNFDCQVMLTTDVISRGIDVENVNLVVNLDVPYDSATYLHRIGRAGRYGSRAVSISIVTKNELENFRKTLGRAGGKNFSILELPRDCEIDVWRADDSEFSKVLALVDENSTILVDNKEDNVKIAKKSKTKKQKSKDECVETCSDTNVAPAEENVKIAKKSKTKKQKSKGVCVETYSDSNVASAEEKVEHVFDLEEMVQIEVNLEGKELSEWEKANKNTNFRLHEASLSNDEISAEEMEKLSEIFRAEISSGMCVSGSEPSTPEKQVEIDDSNEISTKDKELLPLEKFYHHLKEMTRENFYDDLDDEQYLLLKAREWKSLVDCEIGSLRKLLSEPEFFVLDGGRRKFCGQFYSSLEIFFRVQAKALLCVYPEIMNKDELVEMYRFVPKGNVLQCYKDLDEFRDFHRPLGRDFGTYFPYPVDLEGKMSNLRFSENEISEYRQALEYLKSEHDFEKQYEQLKKLLKDIPIVELRSLEKEIAGQENKPSFEELLSFVKNWKRLKKVNEKIVNGNGSQSENETNLGTSVSSEEDILLEEERSESIDSNDESISGSSSSDSEYEKEDLQNGHWRNEDFYGEEENVNQQFNDEHSESDEEDFEDSYLSDNDFYEEEESGSEEFNSNHFQSKNTPTVPSRNVSFNCTDNRNLELFFQNLRIQTDQLHMQLYMSEMYSQT